MLFRSFFATALGIPLPFTPIQILWLNLVTDTPPALALGFDKTDTNAMQRPPRDSKKGIFRRSDVIFILYHGVIMAGLMLGIFLMEINFGTSSIEKARTMAFAMLVLVQLTQAFNARSTGKSIFRRDIFNNKALVLGVSVSFGLLIVGMYMPILSGIFEQVNLGLSDWVKLSTGVVIFVLLAEAFKLIRRKSYPNGYS